MSTRDDRDLLLRAIDDPGATLPRGPGPGGAYQGEHIRDWQLRALAAHPVALARLLPTAALRAVVEERRKCIPCAGRGYLSVSLTWPEVNRACPGCGGTGIARPA